MTRLAQDVCELIDGSTSQRAFEERVLKCFRERVDCDSAYLISFHEAETSQNPPYLKDFVADPLYSLELRRAFQSGRHSGDYIDTDIYSLRDKKSTRIYPKLLWRHGVFYQYVCLLRFNGVVTGALHLNRRMRCFERRQIDEIKPLIPHVSMAHAAYAHAASRSKMAASWQVLTIAQQRVAEALISGQSNREIAGRLHLSPHTVRNHLAEIYQRLNVESRSQLCGVLGPESQSRLRQSLTQVMEVARL